MTRWIRYTISMVGDNPDFEAGKLLEHLRYAGLVHYKTEGRTLIVEFPVPRGPKAEAYVSQVVARARSFGDRAEEFKRDGTPLRCEDHGARERELEEVLKAKDREVEDLRARVANGSEHLEQATSVATFASHGGGAPGSGQRRWAEMREHLEKASAAFTSGKQGGSP